MESPQLWWQNSHWSKIFHYWKLLFSSWWATGTYLSNLFWIMYRTTYLVGCVNSKEISHFLILRLYLLTYFYLQLLLNSRNLSNVWNSFCLILWYFSSPLHISKSFCTITTENQTIIWNSKLFEWEFYFFLFGSIHVYLWTSLLQCYIHPWRLCGYCCSKSNAYLPFVIFTQFGKSSKNPL